MVKCNENNSSIEIDIVDEYLILYSEHMTDEIVNKLLSTPYVRKMHMMTSSNGNIFRVTGPCAVTPPGTQRPVTRSFDDFFDLRLNKRLSKQPWGWWFETLSWSLWRHCNENLGPFFNRLSRVTSARFQPMGEDMCNVFSHWITPCSRDPKTIEIIA